MSIPALIQDCSVKIEGNEKILGIASFKMPEISFKEEEINVLGLGAHKEVLTGQPEALATTIKFLGLDKAALKLKTGKRVNLVLSAAVQMVVDNNIKSVPVYGTFRGTIKKHDLGEITSGGKFEPEIEINLIYFKLEIDNEPQYEIDQINNILFIDGENLRADIDAIVK